LSEQLQKAERVKQAEAKKIKKHLQENQVHIDQLKEEKNRLSLNSLQRGESLKEEEQFQSADKN